MFPLPFQAKARTALATVSLLASALTAQVTAPSPLLTSIQPLGGRPGGTVTLQAKGTDVDETQALVLTHLHDGNLLTVPAAVPAGKKGVLEARLPADARPGLYDLRIRTRQGVSNPRVFQVSPAAIVESTGANTTSATAISVAAESAIHGTFKSTAPHWFSLTGKKGQRLLGAFIGGAWDVRTSLVGTVFDAAGRELARMRDGILDVTWPSDGTFHLKLHDLMFGGGDDYGYRFTLTHGAVIWAANPDTVLGWNLPGGKPTSLRVLRGSPLEHLKAAPDVIAKLVAENPVRPLPLPRGLELPGNDALSTVSIGQNISGWFPADGGARQFDLSFKKDDRFIIEVVSQQLGFMTDPTLLVENVKGDILSAQAEVTELPAPVPAPDTRLINLDPAYGHEARADGLFRLSLSDPSNAANGRRLPFELRIRKAADSSLEGAVALPAKLPAAAATGPHDIPSSNLWRNGTLALEVFVPGRTSVSEAFSFNVGGLPAGVTCLGGFIGRGQGLGYVILKASADAPAGVSALTGIARTNYLTWPVKDTGRETLVTRLAGAPTVAVVPELAPVLIEPASPAVPEVQATGKLEIALKVSRHPGCTEALKLKVLGFTDPAKAPEITVAAKAADGKLSLELKTLKLPPGDHACVLQGTAKMPYQKTSAEAEEAGRKAQKAVEARAAVQKNLDVAQERLKAVKPEDKAALTAQQTKIKDLTTALAAADKARTEAEKTAKALAAKNAPKDTTFLVHSAPIRFRVVEAAKK